MILDPLLLTAFVYVCPISELHSLFARIPSFFATAWLIKDVKDNKHFYRNAVSGLICNDYVFMFVVIIIGRRSY